MENKERFIPLVAFDMPAYAPVGAVRKFAGEADRCFSDGMEHYVKGDYETACRMLERGAAQEDHHGHLMLFLGACYLKAAKAELAVVTLRKAARRSPSAPTIQWLLAQAYLLDGDGKRALAALDKVSSRPGPLQERARSTADRIRKAID